MESQAALERQYRAPGWMRFIVGSNPRLTLIRITVVVVATVVTFKFILLPIRVTGSSMEPTYSHGEIKFVNRLAYRNQKPERGDIVAVQFQGNQILLLKRVIALPGEVFQLKQGEVFIDGELLEEPYAWGKITVTNGPELGNTKPIALGPDEYMVIGDNRQTSEGYQKKAHEILGKVL